jgi:fructose-1,6-bisphosphatase-3
MNISYNNFDMLEIGYGINLRPRRYLQKEYTAMIPASISSQRCWTKTSSIRWMKDLAAKMHKALAICQFKVEGQRIMAHPGIRTGEQALLLDKIDLKNGTCKNQ